MRQFILGRLKKEEKGFTLIELLAVIVILGVIAAIAVPLIGNIIKNSSKDSDVATARQIYDAARLFVTSEKGGNAANLEIPILGTATAKGLQSEGYLDKSLILPSSKGAITGGTVRFDSNGALAYVHIDANGNGALDGETDFYVSAAHVLAGKGDKLSTAITVTGTAVAP